MSPTSKYRLLVVDDLAENIRLMRAILKPAGYDVLAAMDGASALQMAHESAPDLILLDVMMPGMDGYNVCSRLKEDDATRSIPVIFVTAIDDAEAETRGFALGAADFITKPIKLPVVLARVKTHLALYEQHRNLEGMFRDVTEFAPDALFLSDSKGRIVRINEEAERITGYRREELIGQLIEVLLPERFRAGHPALRKRFAAAPVPRRMGGGPSVLLRCKDGSECEVEVSLSRMQTSHGLLFVSAMRDISERRRNEKRLLDQNNLLQAVIQSFPGGVSVVDADLRLVAHNALFPRLMDFPPELMAKADLNYEDFTRFNAQRGEYGPGDPEQQVAAAVARARTFQPHTFERVRPNGLALEIRGMPLPDGGFVSVYMDITQRRHAEEQLRIAAAAFESLEGTVVTDASSVILRVNRAFCQITGYTPDELVGQKPNILKSDRHPPEFFRDMWETIHRTGGWQGEIWDRRKSGEVYPTWHSISAVRDEDGVVTHFVGSQVDITERKKAEEKINELAFFDPLTGLPNRTLLLDRLKQAMTTTARNDRYSALLFIDLDNFKNLNDTQGHDVGDLLLKQVAQRLTQCVREGDTVSRVGGDEFVVVLAGLSASEVEAASDTEAVASKIIATLNQVYRFGGAAHHSTASLGATLFKGNQTSIDDLVKQTDLTMYKAKSSGRNTFRFFDPAMETALKERADLEADLRRALDASQFVLHYQAQVNGNGRVTGAEVLVRWQHPQRGMVSPADFIPLAEDTGLILPLGHWVLETACTQLALWASLPEMAHLTVAVNVSAHQFTQKDFVAQVQAVLRSTGANPQRLKLELTESLLVDNIGQIIDTMTALKASGVGFALDDFGTGYSSLSYLKRLPLDQLKIDQSFVRDVLIDPNDAAIARTIVALAQSLGLGVIAEGVETAEQRDFLAGSGCHAYQGYLFSRPLALTGFETLVRQLGADVI
jgi:diguanylate cyclase (GGDEF)-like protein/PAS domain S-box-containing protein